MALEAYLVNDFHYTEFHPGVLEDKTGVSQVSYFLPEQKCSYTEGSGGPMSLSLVDGLKDVWLKVCWDGASMGIVFGPWSF